MAVVDKNTTGKHLRLLPPNAPSQPGVAGDSLLSVVTAAGWKLAGTNSVRTAEPSRAISSGFLRSLSPKSKDERTYISLRN